MLLWFLEKTKCFMQKYGFGRFQGAFIECFSSARSWVIGIKKTPSDAFFQGQFSDGSNLGFNPAASLNKRSLKSSDSRFSLEFIRSGGTCKTEIFNLGTKYMSLYIALFWASTKYMYFVVIQKNPAQSTSTSNLTWNRIFRYKSTSFLDIFWSKSCIMNSWFWHRVLHTVFSSKVLCFM